MPRVSAFYGVVIYMYWNERDHPVAHFHAYQFREAGLGLGERGGARRQPRSPRSAVRPGIGEDTGGEIMVDWEPATSGTSNCWPLSRWRSIENVSENYLPVVAGVAVVGDHVLRLLFSDGTAGDVNFSAEQWTGVLAPLNDSGS